MADELDLDLDSDNETQEQINKSEKRIKSLSEKVKTTSEERDAEKARADKEAAEAAQARKDAEFYKNFTNISSKYQGAHEFQDQIREKTALGLDVEEATMLVLTKEGKYTPPPPPQPKIDSPTGGSSSTTLKAGEKGVSDMSTDEKRKALEDSLGF